MNEYSHIQQKYFNEKTYIAAIAKEKIYDYQKILQNIRPYGDVNKVPDLISIYGNKIYGIEHFEFDSTKNIAKKGSSYKRQLAKIDHKIDKEIKNKAKVENVTPLMLNQDLQQYINNFKDIFNKHYTQINQYLKNLNLDYPNSKKEIWFFIEDVTPLGNSYLNNKCKPKLFHPMLSMELIELIEKSNKIGGIILAVKNILYIYSNNKFEIDILKKICRKEQVSGLLVQNILCFTTQEKKEIR